MRNAHTVAEVRAAEAELLAALPDGALMARAATGLAHVVIDFLGGCYGRRVLLLVGPGDNGGDALYAGATLARRGASVTALLVGDRAHQGGLAALRAAGGSGSSAPVDAFAGGLRTRPGEYDVVLDGIVGIGGRPGLPAGVSDLLDRLEGVPVIAVDVPSGVEVDTGRLPAEHVTADVTVTFGTHKVAQLVDPAAAACGVVTLVDIGLDLPPAGVTALQAEDVAVLLPVPEDFDHKYTRGVVGVRAGSARYPGAGLLSVAGAASGLAGMVRFLGDPQVEALVHAAHPEVVSAPGRVQAWVVGSGGDQSAAGALAAAVADGVPVVVDADALASVRAPLGVPAVLTPHAGELARMLDVSREEVEADQLRCARLAAARYDAVTLLKGRHSLVVAPDGRARVTTTGLPWLATAGAGDVLAGLIGALLAAGLEPFDAASVGSWLHGAAATIASAGGPVTAPEVAAAVQDACRRVLED
jgi:ADP-dependent NAD(P)H-hydrate dehydratase / NAD(P)H-hydrate epimerase